VRPPLRARRRLTGMEPRSGSLIVADSRVVSAIIIFLNERPFLEQAIASVLNQTYPHWQLLLVDDGSDDGSTAVARAAAERDPARVKYLEHAGHANLGMSASRNLGIRHARGDYLAFLDADDVWLPQKLERQVAILDGHAEVDMVYGDTQWWYSWTGRPEDASRDGLRGIGLPPNTFFAPCGLLRQCYPLGPVPSPAICSFLVRRTAVERVGGFEVAFRGIFEDQALLAKLYLSASILVTDECVARYRQHDQSCVSTSVRSGTIHEEMHVFLKWLETYLRTYGVHDLAIRRALRRVIRPYRYPRLYAMRRRVRRLVGRVTDACWAAGNRMLRAIERKSTGRLTARPNPIIVFDRFRHGATTLEWQAIGAGTIEVRMHAPAGALVARSVPSGSTTTGIWVTDGMCFYLQDVSGGLPLTRANTIAAVRIRVRTRANAG
jgi:glycosyltransferase involved in cell wall biosynthesis